MERRVSAESTIAERRRMLHLIGDVEGWGHRDLPDGSERNCGICNIGARSERWQYCDMPDHSGAKEQRAVEMIRATPWAWASVICPMGLSGTVACAVLKITVNGGSIVTWPEHSGATAALVRTLVGG